MKRLNEILRELGVSKVKLAKCLGVSRQMIYNYLEFDDLNSWPKDKKVILLNILGIKSPAELDNIVVTTDYILSVEARMKSLFASENDKILSNRNTVVFDDLEPKQKHLLIDIVKELKEKLIDDQDENAYNSILYIYHYIKSMESSKELKYILAYVSKLMGYTKPYDFVYDENEQFIFESVLFSAMTLYNAGTASKSKIAATHKRFVNKIEQRMEEKMSRTLEINAAKVQALKELGYKDVTVDNASEVLARIVEIEEKNGKK